MTTWEGFIVKHGLTMQTSFAEDGKQSRWICHIRSAADPEGFPVELPAHPLNREAPTLSEVVEGLQKSIASVVLFDADEFLEKLGWNSLNRRNDGLDAYTRLSRLREDAERLFGEDGLRALLAEVGDEPPVPLDHVGLDSYRTLASPS